MFENLKEQPCSPCDSVVMHCTILEEDFYQPIYKGDLVSDLSGSLARYRFQRTPKESIYVTSQMLGARGCIRPADIRSPALFGPGCYLRLQSSG